MSVEKNQKSISICFCAWNEQDNILTCIDDALKFANEHFPNRYEIIVIDNASTDQTPQVVTKKSQENPAIKLHRHESNRLYSGSYRSAFSVSTGDLIAVLDGDFQHTCQDITKATALMDKAGVDIVYGWKKERHDGILRDIFSVGLRLTSQFLIGHRLHDINCGFRLLKKEAAKKIQIEEKINSVGPELYCEARKLNLKVGEVVVQHFARQAGGGIHGSIMPLLRGTKKFFLYLVRLRDRFGSSPVLEVPTL